MYVLDEPSIGLHQRDNQRLIAHAAPAARSRQHRARRRARRGDDRGGRPRRRLRPRRRAPRRPRRRRGHARRRCKADPDVADRALPGRHRAHRGAGDAPRAARASSTRQGRARAQPARTSTSRFPLGVLVAVTGVSGAGKSSLINGILHPALRRMLLGTLRPRRPARRRSPASSRSTRCIDIDQKPIGRTPRSNPATYTKAFDADPRAVRADAGGARPTATSRAASRSTCTAGAARRARATACARSRCTSCPTCSSPARSAGASATTRRRCA